MHELLNLHGLIPIRRIMADKWGTLCLLQIQCVFCYCIDLTLACSLVAITGSPHSKNSCFYPVCVCCSVDLCRGTSAVL